MNHFSAILWREQVTFNEMMMMSTLFLYKQTKSITVITIGNMITKYLQITIYNYMLHVNKCTKKYMPTNYHCKWNLWTLVLYSKGKVFLKNISLNNKKITVRFREVKKKFLTFFHAQFLLKNNPTHIFSEWIHLLTERNQVEALLS
jgi:hypothetical protein